jgi:hypothetical protein
MSSGLHLSIQILLKFYSKLTLLSEYKIAHYSHLLKT